MDLTIVGIIIEHFAFDSIFFLRVFIWLLIKEESTYIDNTLNRK